MSGAFNKSVYALMVECFNQTLIDNGWRNMGPGFDPHTNGWEKRGNIQNCHLYVKEFYPQISIHIRIHKDESVISRGMYISETYDNYGEKDGGHFYGGYSPYEIHSDEEWAEAVSFRIMELSKQEFTFNEK